MSDEKPVKPLTDDEIYRLRSWLGILRFMYWATLLAMAGASVYSWVIGP